MRAISSTSFFIASTSGLSPISASSSLKRVRMVRRSCETPASIAVRCSIARSMRRLHLDEGLRRAANLARAARAEVRHFAPFAEAFGGVREPQDRADLVAQEQHRDDDQHQRGADHPAQEDVGVRDIGGARGANTRITALSSLMRISSSAERPTVSIQNGRPICFRTSSDSAWSTSEKNGFGPGGGSSFTGRKSTTRPSFSCAMRRSCA